MKRTISLLIVLVLVLAMLAGCGKGGKGSSAAKDTTVMAMSFKVPNGWVTVERFTEKKTDGSLVEKDLKYNFEDESFIGYAFVSGRVLSELTDVSKLETVEKNGTTWYLITSGTTHAAFAQKDKDLYGIQYNAGNGDKENTKPLDDAIASVKFGKESKTDTDEIELSGIKYDTKKAGDVISYSIDREEDTKGNLKVFSVQWSFGKDDTTDYRFIIEYNKGAKIEDILDPDRTYEDDKVGGKDCKVRKDSSGNVIEYIVQNGKDVYCIMNNGKSSWLGVTRTDESKEKFTEFVGSIKF